MIDKENLQGGAAVKDMRERLYGFDNLKTLLIFLVVLGHLLEASLPFEDSDLLLRIIYSFHMPAFVFLTGYFAKFRPRKIIFQFGYTYLLFQALYLLFDFYQLGGEAQKLYFSFPYWLMWYLLATIVYSLLLPLLDVSARWKQAVILLLTVAAALWSGNDPYLGYGLSGARIVSFLPFFVLGFYCGKHKGIPLARKKPMVRIVTGLILTAAVVGCCIYLQNHPELTIYTMYGSVSYKSGHYGMAERAVLMGIALLWIGFFMFALLPLLNRKIPVLSGIGKNTFPIFLLHGFLVKAIEFYKWPFLLDSLLPVLLAAIAILALCGNPFTAWIFRRCLTGEWLDRLIGERTAKKM